MDPSSLSSAESRSHSTEDTTMRTNVRPLEELTPAALAQSINTTFRCQAEHAPAVDLTLIEVTAPRFVRQYESFSIVFRGPSHPLLPQAIYQFQHDAIGTFDLFIVPIRQDQDGLYYEACFNRLRSEQQG